MITENLNKAMVVSTIIAGYYEKLIRFTVLEEEDSDEYNEYIKLIQKAKKEENKLYQNLSHKELIDYINSNDFKNSVYNSQTIAQVRICKKLIEIGSKVLNNEAIDRNIPSLSEIIDNAILLEALKKVNRQIESLEDYDIDDPEVLMKLKAHNKVCKYGQLMPDNYMEELALNYNFNIEKIPLTPLDKIKKEETKDIAHLMMPLLYVKFFKELNILENINYNDPTLNTYHAYVILSKIEIILNNLDKKTLEKITNKFERDHKNTTNETIEYTKSLLRKRKENI